MVQAVLQENKFCNLTLNFIPLAIIADLLTLRLHYPHVGELLQ